jgi:hypothetical protein
VSQKLPPHPIVVSLAETLGSDKVKVVLGGRKPLGAPAPDAALEDVLPTQIGDFGTLAGSPEIKCITGYIGGQCTYPSSSIWWQILFLDANLRNWIIVDRQQILYSDRRDDREAAAGKRDFIWVKADTLIAHGDPQTDPKNLFLTGAFTRAGDYETSVRGDTHSSASGLICDAITPGGCTSNTPRPRP